MGRPISEFRLKCIENTKKSAKIPLDTVIKSGWILLSFHSWYALSKVPVFYPRFVAKQPTKIKEIVAMPELIASNFLKMKGVFRVTQNIPHSDRSQIIFR